MRHRKTLLIVAASFVAVFGLLCLAALTPAVQRVLVLRALRSTPGVEANVARVALGWSRGSIEALQITHPGVRIEVPAAQVRYSLPALILSRSLTLDLVEARGVKIEIRPDAASPATGASETAAPGTWEAPPSLPVALRLGRIQVEAAVEVHASAPLVRRFDVELAGAEPATSAAGLRWRVVAANLAGNERTDVVEGNGSVALDQDSTRRLAAFNFEGVWGRVGAGADRTTIRSACRIDFAAGQGRLTGEWIRPGTEPLQAVEVEMRRSADAPGFAGRWLVRLNPDDLRSAFGAIEIPDWSGESAGTFTWNPAGGSYRAEGRLSGVASRLERLTGELAAIGNLQIEGVFAVGGDTRALALDRLELEVASGRSRVLRIASLQAARYDFAKATVEFARPESDLVRAEISALPVSWLRPFASGFDLEGREISGVLVLAGAADGSRLLLRAPQPVSVTGLGIRQDGITWLERASVSLSPEVEHSAGGTRARLREMSLVTPAGDRIDGAGELLSTGGDAARTWGFSADFRGRTPSVWASVVGGDVPAPSFVAKIAGAIGPTKIALQTGEVRLTPENGPTVLEAKVVQPFAIELASKRVLADRPDRAIVALTCGDLPLKWSQRWTPVAWTGSERLSGVLEWHATEAGQRLRAVQPLRVSGLRTPGAAAEMALEVGLDASIGSAGVLEARLPVTLQTSGRTSAVELAGQATWGADAIDGKLAITGSEVWADDGLALAGLIAEDTAPAGSAGAGRSEAGGSSQPPWQGLTGQTTIRVGKVHYGRSNITDLQGDLVVTPAAIELRSLTGTMGGSPLQAAGRLDFDAARRPAYQIAGSSNVPGFDAGAWLRAMDPRSPPAVESIVTVSSRFTGGATGIELLAERMQGSVRLEGGKGVFRGLARGVDKVAAGASLLGLIVRDERMEAATQAVNEMAEALREIPFERLTLEAQRGADLRLQLSTIELLGAEVRLTGKGVVEMSPELPLARQKQRLELRLAFRGERARRWVERGWLAAEPDAAGYFVLKTPLVVTGTLLQPNTKEFYRDLLASFAEMGLRAKLGE